MQKSKIIILFLILLTLGSCKISEFERIQGGLSNEWKSGTMMPLNWPLMQISADTFVTPITDTVLKSYPSDYSNRIACLYYNDKYAVRLDSSFVLIPQDTTKEKMNEERFYVDSYLFGHLVDTDSIGYAMTYIPTEDRYRYYILNKNFDFTRFKQNLAYRKFVVREKILIFENKDSFVDALKTMDIKPIFERVEGWDPKPDSIKSIADIQRSIRDRSYNITSFRPYDKTIHNYVYNCAFNTFLPISKNTGRAIDQQGIVDYSNDTLYVFKESLEVDDFESRYYIKTKAGLFELVDSTSGGNCVKEKIHHIVKEELTKKTRKYYNSVFEWEDLQTFLLRNWSSKNRAYAELIRIIIIDYKIEYIDICKFEDINIPIVPKQET